MTNYTLSRSCLAFVWIYQGLVPKLIHHSNVEMGLIKRLPQILPANQSLIIAGVLEILLGLALIVAWRKKWPAYTSLVAFSLLLLASIGIWPQLALEAFNPITTTIPLIILSWVNLKSA